MTLRIDVERRLGAFQLRVAFAADAGITALFGRSGAGKTSVVNMIAGLLKPDHGRIESNGRVLYDSAAGVNVPVHERRVACVFQDARLFPHLSVRNNLLYGFRLCPARGRYIEFNHVVELLGIAPLLSRRTGTLSGGERQRVAIGRALLAQPRLLLMDEPLASLDTERKVEILPYIERLRDEFKLSIVYVSHALEEVVRLAGNVVVMRDGAVTAVGPVAETLERVDLYPITGRQEAGAILSATVASHDDADALTMLRFNGGVIFVPRVDLPVGAALRVRIRARDVALAVQQPAGISIRNILRGRVAEITEKTGADVEIKLMVGATALAALVTRPAVRDLALAPGREVYALVKSIAIDDAGMGMLALARHAPKSAR
ncbi:MAG TPA: molybdenum ABC transporter ATP-binding protein [Gammaproteobacteria bacterium]|nr:molybdenum ABC transporter ATP-binding protein [Gammaproteobacteria bacterium]